MESIAVIGLGYVGLPLAVEFGKHMRVVGFDISTTRVEELRTGIDRTGEVEADDLRKASNLSFTTSTDELRNTTIYIVTVPTPVDDFKQPDLAPLTAATRTVSKVLKKNDLVIYVSTVYPGCTEEVCVPILEAGSGLKFNIDFFCGYSPERINPGDKLHRVTNIKKVTSGSTPEIAEKVDMLYREIITAGTHKASSIKVAEAAKVIENAQRDLNIAFVNELALIFEMMGIDTLEVLEAAGTKWNFLPFRPGLVGGHCIGVDPYYLTHKAEGLGYHPQVILSGRMINDTMGKHIANVVIKLMARNNRPINKGRVLVLGIAFKENCSDIRNSKVADIVRELESFGAHVDVFDPLANPKEVKQEYGISLIKEPAEAYDAVILAVGHQAFQQLDWKRIRKAHTVVYDVKGFLDRSIVTARL